MRSSFEQLATDLESQLRKDEVFTAWFAGEQSDFVRFNHSKVRQPGTVSQRRVTVDWIDGKRHCTGTITLSGDGATDRQQTKELVERLRRRLPQLPEDPHLMYNTNVSSTEHVEPHEAPDASLVVDRVLSSATAVDLVGYYAGGPIYRGFANSLGQRNWFASASFNLDWSLYHRGDKAVKRAYAGFAWDDSAWADHMHEARTQLEILKTPPKTIEPGRYRVYLAPAAVNELMSLLCWEGFGLRSHRTKQTPFLKLIGGAASSGLTRGAARLHPSVTLVENVGGGAGPRFGDRGYIKPNAVDLIRDGKLANTLNSPRSAREYGAETNGASDSEAPTALELSAGELVDPIAALDTGLYVGNLWYLNYSHRAAGRVTGMTRFATFWVENGKPVAPVNVMRFDDSIFAMLGDQLEALTRERELILSNDTYFSRSTDSMRLPGALLKELNLTL